MAATFAFACASSALILAAAPSGLVAGFFRSSAFCGPPAALGGGQIGPSNPPVATPAGTSRLLTNIPARDRQKCALNCAFCSGVFVRKLQMFLGAPAAAGA